MAYYLVLFVTTLLTIFQETSDTGDSYSAVVVEYSPTQDPSVDPATNILNNVRNFVNLTNIANDKFQETSGTGDSYSAVVVEYSPTQDPSVDPATNILNNVRNFVNLTNIANDKFQETSGTGDSYSTVVVEYSPTQDPSVDLATNILNNVRNFVNITNIANDKFQETSGTGDSYSTVVVEYSPTQDPSVDPATNILNNVRNFVNITNIANDKFQETSSTVDSYSAVVVEYSPTQDPSVDPATNILNNVRNFVNLTNIANDKFQETSGTGDSYSAVVVEYSPTQDPSVDPATNILNNVRNFVNITNIANDKFQETSDTGDSYSAVVVEYSPTQDPSVDPATNILNNVRNFVNITNIANDKFQETSGTGDSYSAVVVEYSPTEDPSVDLATNILNNVRNFVNITKIANDIFQETSGTGDSYSAVVVEYSPTEDPSVDPATNILNNVRNFVNITNIANDKFQETSGTGDSYSAVVVEYSPTEDPSIDPATNILNNIRNFVNLTNIANDKFQADIIVFPEGGLTGYDNQEQYVQVPDPLERVRPCAANTTYDAPLVQLSCAARATQTYIVVNLGEKLYNTSQQKTVYFNTDVVFDSNGTIIARYRKIHLFMENEKSPSPNRELVYFDTAFGVRFGIFTCFDIIFEDPGVILANKFNITHFIFPTEWFSQMPFLAAIQEQYYWSYAQDVVLLASGYNDPSMGSSGTGIYLGRRGPATYNMTQTRQTFMLHADVPKKIRSKGVTTKETKNLKTDTIIITRKEETLKKPQSGHVKGSPDKIKLKQESFLKMYATKRITPPESSMQGFNGSNFTVPFTVEENICQNDLCCRFSLNITAIFNKTTEEITRGDDYSQMFYRLVVFDGVRHYDNIANGGLQTCAIISCINSDISSCGLRSDNSTAHPNMIYSFFQTAFIFDSIKISGNFSTNHSSVGPNVLLTGEGDNFGSLLPPESFMFGEARVAVNGTVERSFQTLKPVPKLVTASVYGRLFLRDDRPSQTSSSGCSLSNSFFILVITFVLICNYY